LEDSPEVLLLSKLVDLQKLKLENSRIELKMLSAPQELPLKRVLFQEEELLFFMHQRD